MVGLGAAVLVSVAPTARAVEVTPGLSAGAFDLTASAGTANSTEDDLGYQPGTGIGAGYAGALSVAALVRARPPEGVFVQDSFSVAMGMGPKFGSELGLFAHAFVGVGLKAGVALEAAAFYVHPRVFTGFHTVRAPLGSGTGSGRAAWVINLGTAFDVLGAEVGYGRGYDTSGDRHTVVEVSGLYLRGRPALSIAYQGLFGTDIDEHGLTVGAGTRF